MDVEESQWVSKTTENITRYLNRGGKLEGDKPQVLEGTDLLNTIGVAMGLPLRDPQKWSEDEKQKAFKNNLVYFEGDAKKAIDVIANQIKDCCDGDEKVFVTVLPVELYCGGKLYELPVFRVHRYKNSKQYYVDNVGRSYNSVNDWYTNNTLPPCKMAYPSDLQLTLKPETNSAHVTTDDTPSARVGSKVIQEIDIATSVVGILSGVGLIFVSGGLAAPLVAAGATAAIWGTGRAAQELIDKSTHGENINPFKNTENAMLWLGIAANVVSFSSMGASMKLASLAARGRDITKYFRILVDVMNGTNIVVSGSSIIATTVYLIEYYDQLSPVDILVHVASMAFWTKGLFTFKTAGGLIKNVQDHTFKVISNELSTEDANRLTNIRNQFNNDAQLIREFHRVSKSNISIQTFCEIVIDTDSLHGNIKFDEVGNLILEGNQKYSIELLGTLPRNIRKTYFDVIDNLRADQIEQLESFRQRVNNDTKLIMALHTAEVYFNITLREATEQLLKFWVKYKDINISTNNNISVHDGALVIDHAPPLPLNNLQELSNSMIRFVCEDLAHIDKTISRQWEYSIPILLRLESQGMFSTCQVTKITPGRAVVLLNENLEISIYKLFEIESNDCSDMLRLVGQLPSIAKSTEISKDIRLLLQKYRLQLEGNRREIVNWMIENANERLLPILDSKLQNFERDRLFTFKSTITTAKAMPYMAEMMSYVSDWNPRNVSEMVSYGEYVITYVEAQKRGLEVDIRNGRLQLPANIKKADFLRQLASQEVFSNPLAMLAKWDMTLALVRENGMVGPCVLEPELSDEVLIMAMRTGRIGFGSEAAAVYHVLKHPTDPASAYIDRANEVIRNATRWQVSLTQDGDARIVRFESPEGSAIVLERDGRVLLCTFSPKSAKA